jgi:uncharacterized protein YndB with AHSA1/START domain
MPTNKDFKRLVRGRMQKTGESYTAARLQLLTKKPTPAPIPGDYAKLAGMSDATLKAKTGCTWDRWVWALDRVEAYDWEHREIAGYVHEKYKVSGWWAQTVTVGYERIKGLRAVGQRRGGGFEANKSRTFAVPLARLYRAFHDKRTRTRWLPGVDMTIRVATREKSMRITWPDKTSVELYFSGTGEGKAQVQIQHRKLPDQAAAARMKHYWEVRLAALGDVLAPSAKRRT